MGLHAGIRAVRTIPYSFVIAIYINMHYSYIYVLQHVKIIIAYSYPNFGSLAAGCMGWVRCLEDPATVKE